MSMFKSILDIIIDYSMLYPCRPTQPTIIKPKRTWELALKERHSNVAIGKIDAELLPSTTLASNLIGSFNVLPSE